jgi:hypothetical protein
MTYKYNLVSLDFDTVKQELIDDEQNKALEYLDTMSKEELNDIMFKCDDKVNTPRFDLHCDFLYEVCEMIKEKANGGS